MANEDKKYNFYEDKKAYLGYGFFIGAIIATTVITML